MATNQYGVVQKKWITAFAFSLFLGVFGVDRFYLGKVGTGILKLLTIGGFGIWALIDFILIATRSMRGVEWVHDGKNDKRTAWILFGVAVLLGALGSTNANRVNQTVGSSTPTTSQSTPVDTKGTNYDAATDQTKTQPETPKTWQKVYELSGTTSKRSDSFKLSGAQARLKYAINNATSYDGMTSIYVVEDGHSLEKDGGFPEVSVTGAKSDETRLVKSAGSYYLDITAANTNWTATVEEYK